ncbi:AMP-binding protein [Halomicrobium sp. HM KBTZ05]|uniref:AMP-binding protein n=1 Tax=Halomicrobium sp. HM KBTZ05 TaxID=3242663 RepID=UPI003557751C
MSEHGPQRWVGDWSARRRALSPDRVGLVDATSGTEYTYAELDRRANGCARLLADHGVTREGGADPDAGGRVAVLSRNRPEFVDLFFATGKTGGVLAPLSHRLAPPELGTLLDDVAPSLLVVEEPFADDAAEALADADIDCPVRSLATAGETTWDRLDESLPADRSPYDGPTLEPAAPHLFLHTGGSTGTPKETVLSHEAIVWNATNTVTAWGLRPDDVTPLTFPMFHTGGWNVLTVPVFHMGGTVVLAREFDPGEVLELIEARSATLLVAVPAVLRMMVDHERWAETDLSTLRLAKSGGGPCRESVLSAWWDRGVDLSQGYGLTECGPNNFAMPDDWPSEKADTVGVPNVHVDVRIVDDTGTELPRGEVGELHLRSPHAATEYWHRPEATAATFREDGWLATGDLARIDDDGYVSIEGRKKNMYVSGGENVFPAAVEDAVSAHPKVDDVVVVPVEDDQWGEVGRAVVVGDDSLTLEELTSFLDGRLARYKRPRDLVFVASLPRSGPDKIDRDAVADEYGS